MKSPLFLCESSSFHRALLCLSLIIISIPVFSQLKADFTSDRIGGCAPLSVSFTNTTTGASANAVYTWDLGNGNTSSLKNTGALFFEERTYNVTLTVKDGSQSSTVTKTITVYKKPVVDFTVAPNKGCLPLKTLFSASAQTDGTITSYNWDFGDGSILQFFNSSVEHYYNFEQLASVSLTATNNHGCSGTITKKDIVTVLAALEVGFTADKTMVCSAPGTITFTNSSTGPGTLNYTWDFGDGGRSAEKDPVHTYTRKGTYTVKLTVSNSEGCSKEFVRDAYINIADFTTEVEVPALVCTDVSTTFRNTSRPIPVQCEWMVDNNQIFYTWGTYHTIYYTFMTEGPHTIRVTNNFGPCIETKTITIDVKKSPKPDGFIVDILGLCGAPVAVNFKDTTQGAVSWQWNFNWWLNNTVVHSTEQAPSYNYTADNNYYAMLTVTNAAGCKASTGKTIGISKPLVGIFLDPDSRVEGCVPHKVKFDPRSTEAIIKYEWKFGDGGTSTLPNPEYTYTQAGSYPVTLTYTTVNGCTGTASFYDVIRARQKPVANFSIQPTVCGNTPVYLTNTSTGYYTGAIWNFGDNTGDLGLFELMHQYQQAGDFTIRLVAYNGMCNDTITKTNIVKVSAPFARIDGFANTCDGTRGDVVFTDGSRDVNSWTWDFGDNTPVLSYTTARPTVSHTYTRTGTYKVVLTTVNGACTVKDSTTVYVLLKQKPVLTFDRPEVCVNSPVGFHIRGLEVNPSPYAWSHEYNFRKMEYSDGTRLVGDYYSFSYWITDVDGNLNSYQPKEDKIRCIMVSSHFNCEDTTNYVPIKFKGASAGFEVVTDGVCFKSPVVFRDTSKASSGSSITSWQWNFGDGNVVTNATGGTVSHIYANPGTYYVTLRITDQSGCVSNTTTSTYVYVTGPKAAFGLSTGTNVQLNTTVQFYNYTNTAHTSGIDYLWDFGNGITSTDPFPSYTYTEPGTYIVRLIAVNTQTQCRDTARQTITVRNFNTAFTTTASFIGNYNQCPPVLARFVNTSVNYTRVVWDFGDGTTLENQNYPNHIYNVPGTYVVKLFVYGFNGLTGTYTDTVRVTFPQATIQGDDLEGCIGHNLLLNAPIHTGVSTYLWDFGDGRLINSTDSFATHQYIAAGNYSASLIVKDNGGCASSVSLPGKVIIHPNPTITVAPAAPVVCKGVAVQLQANGAESYTWSPATGLTDPAAQNPLASPSVTTPYSLVGTDANGCTGTGNTTVIVAEPIQLHAGGPFNICYGDSVKINAGSGADSYKWINNVAGLSNTTIQDPIASPASSTLYTVVGFDQYQCYSDTADMWVNVRSLPWVNAGPDREVMYGSENTLNVTNSNDVTRWNWTPPDFLNCTRCAAPVSKPYGGIIDYVVTVYNEYNCSAKDTIRIKGFCTDGKIFIPTAFSPNNDGKSDRFTIMGSGISIIRSLKVYNRWGEIVFHKKDFYPNDLSSAWNGKFKGVEAPAGAYVYFAEMECNAGERFERKGSVMLVR